MKICIIHGSPRKGNTFKATEIFKEELKKYDNFEFEEYFLPKDMPHFCCGCYACFDKGPEKCPHAQYVQPIVNSIKEAYGLIVTSPVFCLAESGAVKALLDHMSYLFMNHKPMEEMFTKVAMVISTTAGYGTDYAIKPISRAFRFWGMRRVVKCGLRIYAKNWNDMSPEKQQQFEDTMQKKAQKFYKILNSRNNLQPYIFTRAYFYICRKLLNSFSDGNTDKEYWREKGWLTTTRPF